MQRVALAMPNARVRQVLVELAGGEADVELAGELPAAEGAASDSLQRLAPGGADGAAAPAVSAAEPDLAKLEADGARDLLAGEVELDRRRRLALVQDDVSVLVGWIPVGQVRGLRETLSRRGRGGGGAPLAARAAAHPAALHAVAGPFRILVDTYGVLPYSDVDPTAFAAVAFLVMFGMMFGDLGHGAHAGARVSPSPGPAAGGSPAAAPRGRS